MIVHRSIVRYNGMSNEFREFCAGCENYFDYWGGKKKFKNSVSRCYLLPIKKECNSQNCPFWDYEKNHVLCIADYDTSTSRE